MCQTRSPGVVETVAKLLSPPVPRYTTFSHGQDAVQKAQPWGYVNAHGHGRSCDLGAAARGSISRTTATGPCPG